MNQYQFHGAHGLHQQQQQQHHHHPQQYKHDQPLTPISTLTSHYQDSPAQSHTLPPLHPPSASAPSFAPQQQQQQPPPPPPQHYRPAPSHTPRLPHTPDTPSNAEHPGMSHAPHVPATEPHASYAPISHGLSAPPHSATYSHLGHQQHSLSNGSAQYPQVSLPQINSNPLGMDYRQHNGLPSYQYPPQQLQQPHQPPPLQQQPSQGQPQLPGMQGQDRRPLPVVGSQGRRGILPTSGGKAPPPGSAPDGTMRGGAPVNRNSENKYPCNYCNKTYLHLKHLKRHHLRHTGERPYQCGLCHETFCRSDILKRHFNKCSIRRGNPTGANHLTHAQDHLKGIQGPPLGATNGGTALPQQRPSAISTAAPNPPSSYPSQWPGSARSFDGYGQQMSHNNVGGSTRSSRSSSIMRPESSSDDDTKKRFSSTSTLPTAAGTAETSPSASTQSFAFNNDRVAGAHHQRDGSNGAFYHTPNGAHMPPLPSHQTEHLPPMNYIRSGFSQYQQPSHEHMYHGNWNNAFQPGGSDQMMYSGAH